MANQPSYEELEQRVKQLEKETGKRKRVEREESSLAKFPSENPNPVLRVANDGTILYANKASQPLLNVWGCQIGQRLPDQWCQFTADVISSGSSEDIELECEDRVFSVTFGPVMDADYVNLYGLDITRRKQAEKALLVANERLQYLLCSTSAVIYTAKASGNYGATFISKNITEMVGYEPREFLDNASFWFDHVHPEDQARVSAEVAIIFQRERHSYEYRFRRKDGTYIWVRDEMKLVLDSDGKPLQIVGFWADITDRKLAEKALRRSEEQYHRIVNTAQEGIWVVDAEARVNYVNQQLADMLGYTVEKILGRYLFDFMDDLSPAAVGESLKGHTQETTGLPDFRFRRKDGSDLWGMVSSSPMFDDNAQFVGALGMIIDVTKRKQAEEALRRSREELRDLAVHLQAAREQERAIIAREIHDDLGQTLSALKIDLTSLEKRLPKDEEGLIDKTKSIARFIDTIVQSVKRIYSGLRPFVLDDLGLIPAMEWMAKGFQDRTGIKCELFISPEDIVVDKDLATTIFRIFQETLSNIGSHANATSVKVSLGENGTDLILIVSDNGKGIMEKQVSDSKSFGLMGMRERALAVGGEVNIRGIENEGTTVKVKIPRKK
jgi:PAS domain S-box-containing protein